MSLSQINATQDQLAAEPVISYQQVHKSFGERRIYEGLDLEVRPGETLVVLGGSGVGKSVMVKMLIGLLRPDSGHIMYRGQDLAVLEEEGFVEVRKQVSMVFQMAALFDSLTVGENIAYPLREHFELDEGELVDRVAGLLELVHLPGIEDRYPQEISGGMRKRIGLARALAMDPKVILYDEPTTGLDPESTMHVSKLVREIQAERGVTSMVITHDLGSAFFIADRLAFLEGRRIRQVGTPQEMRRSEDPVVRAFIEGRPATEDGTDFEEAP